MSNVNYPDKVPGASVTSADLNNIKEAVNSKFDESHVGGPDGLVRAGADGLVEVEQIPTTAALQALAAANDEAARTAGNAVAQIAGKATGAKPWTTIEDILAQLADQEGGFRIPIGAIEPSPGHAIMQLDTSELTNGTRFHLVLNGVATTVALVGPAVDEANPDLPAQMVAGTHYSTPLQYEDGQRIDVNLIAPPASSSSVLSSQILFDGAEHVETIPFGAPMPYSISFTPENYADIWQWGVATWPAAFRARAVSANGQGQLSAPVLVSIDQDDSYFVRDADWGFTEERDPTAAGGAGGKSRTIVAVTRVIPAGYTLHRYSGELPYVPANHAAIHNEATSPAIAPGDNVLSLGAPVGATRYGILLLRKGGSWHPASSQKSFTVQGLIPAGAPTMVTAPVQSGNGKIGTDQNVTMGMWTGSPDLEAQWLRDGEPIPGATNAAYPPVAADDVTDLSCRIRATNAGGTTEFVTPPVEITYPAPTVANAVTAKTYAQESGAVSSFSIANVFAGAGFDIEISGPSIGGTAVASVNSDEKIVSIRRNDATAAAEVTLRARNSGGFAEVAFPVTITASGTSATPFIRGVGGSNSGGVADFENYLADDAIYAIVRRNSAAGFTKPDLPAWSDDYDWVQLFYATSASQTVGVYRKRANGNGNDGSLGDWSAGLTSNLAFPTYFSVGNVNWLDPDGVNNFADLANVFQASAANTDHPAMTPEGVNSILIDAVLFASQHTGQAPGLRPDAIEIASSITGMRKMISKLGPSPATAIAAALDVPHNVAGGSGVQTMLAFEIKGAATTSALTWPANTPAAKVLEAREVKTAAEASTAGFANESGHLMYKTATDIVVAATTVSGDFELVREVMGGQSAAPAATGNLVAQNETWYSGGRKTIGTYGYIRFWWRHKATGAMRLSLSIEPFQIVGLPGSATTWPALGATGTAENELRSIRVGTTNTLLHAYPKFNTEPEGWHPSTRQHDVGPSFSAAAYASFQGNTDVDAYTLTCVTTLLDGWEPSGQAGYAAQHDEDVYAGIYWLSKTPRLWNNGTVGLNSTQREKLDLIMKSGIIGAATCSRETGDTGNGNSMLGWANRATEGGNPNFRCAPRMIVMIVAAYMGGAANAKAFLNSLTATNPAPTGKLYLGTLYADLVAKGLNNAAASLNPTRRPGAPSYATIIKKCTNWTTFGAGITETTKIFAAEALYCFDQECSLVCLNKRDYTGPRAKIKGTATTALQALVTAKAIGKPHEFETVDANTEPEFAGTGPGLRSSASYCMMGSRTIFMGWTVGLHAGLINKTNADAIKAKNQIAVGLSYMKEITKDEVGYLSIAHLKDNKGGGKEDWWYSKLKADWGLKVSYALGDLVADLWAA